MSILTETERVDRIVFHLCTKLCSVVNQARATPEPEAQPKIDQWFKLDTPVSEVLKKPVRNKYRSISKYPAPPPLEIQVLLSIPELTNNQVLVYLAPDSSRVLLEPSPNHILLESWVLSFTPRYPESSDGVEVASSTLYKHGMLLFRSLFSLLRILPAWKLCTRFRRRTSVATNRNFSLQLRIRGSKTTDDILSFDTPPSTDLPPFPSQIHEFPFISYPTGILSLSVTYSTSPNFQLDERDFLLSSRFLPLDGAVDFVPTLTRGRISDLLPIPIPRPKTTDPDNPLASKLENTLAHAHVGNENSSCYMTPIENHNGNSKSLMEDRTNSIDQLEANVDPMDLLEALSNSRIDISPWKSPEAWLKSHRDELFHLVYGAILDTGDRQICEIFLMAGTVYQRSAIYTYWRLKTRVEEPGHLINFRRRLETWSIRENSIMNSLLDYRLMGDELRGFLRPKGLAEEASSTWSCEDDPIFKHVLELDIISMCVQLRCILSAPKTHREFLAWRGTEAQTLLNLVQLILDFPPLNKSFRGPFVQALLTLSRKSGLYPECLVLRDIHRIGEDPVAAGRYGEVWRGRSGDQQVAIKVLRLYERTDIQKHLKAFSREAILWKQMDHVNILCLHGIYHLNENRLRVCLVSPWMANGNIRQYLHNNPLVDRLPLISDVAVGLEYLHANKIVHGDLKGMNILVNPSHRACLADFGLSSASDSQALKISSVSTTPAGGTLRWQAPELFDDTQKRATFQTDIYAYGCVCYEIFADNIPFHEIANDYAVTLRVMQGKRPLRPSPARDLDDEIWSLVQECWNQAYSQRPAARQIVQRLWSKLDFPQRDMRPLTDPLPTIPYRFL